MRHRWMCYATGLPGWMRFGYSPGWVGRSPTGLGPCATYFMTGQSPMPGAAPAWGEWPWAGFQPAVDELAALKTQAQWLRSQLDAISKHVEELEKEA
ncbi:MAG: hypothetical protein CEE40_09470 [Chloroflexi bacterium B3_Chlor]|nr:MAG: hypothetical protein CEE40_09470 [Chloroflexi bacterium B3_Chlor]